MSQFKAIFQEFYWFSFLHSLLLHDTYLKTEEHYTVSRMHCPSFECNASLTNAIIPIPPTIITIPVAEFWTSLKFCLLLHRNHTKYCRLSHTVSDCHRWSCDYCADYLIVSQTVADCASCADCFRLSHMVPTVILHVYITVFLSHMWDRLKGVRNGLIRFWLDAKPIPYSVVCLYNEF